MKRACPINIATESRDGRNFFTRSESIRGTLCDEKQDSVRSNIDGGDAHDVGSLVEKKMLVKFICLTRLSIWVTTDVRDHIGHVTPTNS